MSSLEWRRAGRRSCGWGTRGLYSAWSLAWRGFRVGLVEEHRTAGQPVEMHLGRRVTQIEIDDNAVRVQCGDRGPAITARIYFSIVTAAIAADLMAEGLSRDKLSSAFLSEYEKRWRRQLGSEVRMQVLFRLVSARLNDGEVDQLLIWPVPKG